MKIVRHSINIPTTNKVDTCYVNLDGYIKIYRILNQKNILLTGQPLVEIEQSAKYVDSTGLEHKYLKRLYLL